MIEVVRSPSPRDVSIPTAPRLHILTSAKIHSPWPTDSRPLLRGRATPKGLISLFFGRRPVFLFALVVFVMGCAQTEQVVNPGSHSPARLKILAGDAALEFNRLNEAQEHYQQALALSRDSGSSEDEILACRLLGIVAEQRGALKDAYDHYLEALQLQHSIAPGSAEVPDRLHVASMALALQDPEDARSNADIALEYAAEQQRFGDMAQARWILGEVAELYQHYAEANTHLRRATLLFSRTQRPQAEAGARLALGRVLLAQGQSKEAIAELAAARRAFARGKDARGEVQCLIGLARAYERRRQPENALTFWERALELCRDNGLDEETKTAQTGHDELTDRLRPRNRSRP